MRHIMPQLVLSVKSIVLIITIRYFLTSPT